MNIAGNKCSEYFSMLFAGDLRAFGGPSPDQDTAGLIRSEQIKIVRRSALGMLIANACNAMVLAMALWTGPDRWLAVSWASVVVSAAVFLGIKANASWRSTQPQFVSRRAMHGLVRNASILGSIWGIVPVVFFADASNGGQLVITCLCAGMLAGGAFAFATIPIAAIAFTFPILLGVAIFIGQNGDFVYSLVAILTVVYAFVLLRIVLAHSFEFAERLIAQLQAERAVREDTLTRLPNRLAFNERLDECLKGLLPGHGQFVLVLLDLDHFKEVNDQFGHPAGDELLVQIAARLRRSARAMEMMARLGGDEFAIIAEGAAEREQAFELAGRLQSIFSEPFWIDDKQIKAAASIGIALAPGDGSTAAHLLKRTDAALYRAKRLGRGSMCFHEASDDIAAREHQALKRELALAIENDQLFLVYQPFYDLRLDRVTGFEALLRWRHSTRGVIAPLDFIPLAEETGLIHSIGNWVIRRACETLAEWPSDLRIAVNLSAIQLQNAGVLNTVVSALADNRVHAGRLEVELTESMLISNYEAASGILSSMLALGVTVALDDFGTGYSSLTHLRKIPFDRIKIDRSFTNEMLNDDGCAAIVKSIIRLATDLNMNVVAEGIETQEELNYLRDNGCAEGQGYFIGKPMLPAQALALIARELRGQDQLSALGR
ncbi:bifunctional diguanylate cyclase/phosphodiesterase [Bradyrhizobium sp. JYMT SZCCT0428]|uniref:putative bifunctional diguanylate cyclase/phosphodiesterase n=1 Tax=Bradyrhizobium sp. JYMT SZCCT0428 TaxID=2807673 RepID=UPI001BABD807|nr:GGDEF domain-containing phosphodiesterase [Bradyrhizobium sp. JYMT SZCCT0428]MBR1156086.1 EAL domain-containing protein [Bradyrhizobium sp. JYMT SZCCT0428]